MTELQERYRWAVAARIASVIVAAAAAVVVPLKEAFPFLNHWYLEWPESAGAPGTATAVANMGILIFAVVLRAGVAALLTVTVLKYTPKARWRQVLFVGVLCLLGLATLWNRDVGYRVLIAVGVCIYGISRVFRPIKNFFEAHSTKFIVLLFAAMVIAQLTWRRAFEYPMKVIPLSQFGLGELWMAMLGIEIYIGVVVWCSIYIYLKDPLSPSSNSVVVASSFKAAAKAAPLWVGIPGIALGALSAFAPEKWKIAGLFICNCCLVLAFLIYAFDRKFLVHTEQAKRELPRE